MSPAERRATFSLAGIFALRMIGLFMFLPVFSLHADRYDGYSATLTGLAIGIYGLTQACFQIPFGALSDRIGRKPVIAAGLLLFAAGSATAALSTSIWGVIAGRALQGAGAIAAAIMALAADLTRENQRTKAMAIIGVSIGASFGVALVLGPVVTNYGGISSLFWLTAALALAAIGVLAVLVPTPSPRTAPRSPLGTRGRLAAALRDGDLVRLDVGIFVLHLVLTATFVVLPLTLRDRVGVESGTHWQIYLGVLAVSALFMGPAVMLADRHDRVKELLVAAIALLALALFGLSAGTAGLAGVVALLVLYFAAFNILEASLPSLVSRLAPDAIKGTALGIYSTSQFAGAFCGGVIGGALHGVLGEQVVYAGGALATVGWLAVAGTMRSPRADRP